MKRIDQLDGLRAVAILAVFLNHVFYVKMLWAGVDLFFILSGFLITGILIRAKDRSLGSYFGHFYGRRARRILPPFILLLVFFTAVFQSYWIKFWYLYPFFMNFYVFIHQWSMPDQLAMLWSLAVEEQFYLVWPFVIFFLPETAIAWAAGFLFLLAPFLRWLCTPLFPGHWQIYILTPFRMDLLAAGALLSILWRRHPERVERYGIYGLGLSAAAVAVFGLCARHPGFSTLANTRTTNVWIYELTLLTSLGIVLWALGGRYVGILKWPPILYLGRVSYTFYLIHLCFILLAERWITNRLEIALLAGAAALLYSTVSWYWIEKPILFWKPRSRVRQEAEQDEQAITTPNA